jgi:hypothetical protein
MGETKVLPCGVFDASDPRSLDGRNANLSLPRLLF